MRTLKEKLANVILNPTEAQQDTISQSYEFPDGRIITVNEQRRNCAEILFTPSRAGFVPADSQGLPSILASAISKSGNAAMQCDMWKSIRLSGGNTELAGFSERLLREIRALAPPNTVMRMRDTLAGIANGKSLAPWLGGSILGSLSCNTYRHCLLREEYLEGGVTAVYSKFGNMS